jgi:hypothetical protein
MDLIKIVSGIVLMVLGGKGTLWLVGMILKGASTENLGMVVAGGILSYFLLAICVASAIAGFILFVEEAFGW